MRYEEYVAKRNELINSARTAFGEGRKEDAEKLKAQVTELDNSWEEQCKFESNMKALEGSQIRLNMNDVSAAPVSGSVVDATEEPMMDVETAVKSDEYVAAWAKSMMNRELSADDSRVYDLVNDAYTHTTGNTGSVIPTTVTGKIWKLIAEKHPFFNDIIKTYVKGKLTVITQTSSSDAAWYEESTSTADGKEILGTVELSGCELSRAITISWKLKEMAVEDFLNYIVVMLAEKMGNALGYGMLNGAGVVSGNPTEPLGICTAIKKETSTPQKVDVDASTGLKYTDLTTARALVASGYDPDVYANSKTIWNELANVVDGEGRPIFMADAMNGGVYRVLGCVVKEDAGMADNEILFSDASTYQANINKDVTVSTEEHVKARLTDYCAYAICDGAPLTTKASSLIVIA